MESHEKFRDKYHLPFFLGSDTNRQACSDYGVWKEKNMYGKKIMGLERTTFLIDADGIIQKIWRRVQVDRHIDQILKVIL